MVVATCRTFKAPSNLDGIRTQVIGPRDMRLPMLFSIAVVRPSRYLCAFRLLAVFTSGDEHWLRG